MTATTVQAARRRVARILIGAGVVLTVGWGVAMIVAWPSIAASPALIAYLVTDLAVVVPISILAGVALLWRDPRDLTLLQLALGALAYACLHCSIYLIGIRFLGLPAVVYIVILIVVLLVLVRIAIWGYRQATWIVPN
jgi:hypothetical protein